MSDDVHGSVVATVILCAVNSLAAMSVFF